METQDSNQEQLEQSEVTETVEAAQESSEQDNQDWTLESLIDVEFDDPIMKGEHKNLPHPSEIMKHMTPEGRKLLQNFRADYTRKTQELAKQKKEIQAQIEAIQNQNKLLLNEELHNSISETLKKPVDNLDPWDPEDQKALIERAAAEKFNQMLEPLRKNFEQQQKEVAWQKFLQEAPDFDEVKADVAQVLKERPHFTTKDAYQLVKAQKLQQQIEEDNLRKLGEAQERVSGLSRVSGGKKGGYNNEPQFASAWDAYQYYKNNPEAKKSKLKKFN